MATTPEQRLSRSLRSVLADLPNGGSVPDSDEFREVLVGLQYFVPVVLSEIHREWRFHGLDDVLPVLARKTGDGEIELFGLCCFVSDQTLTPLQLHLQVAASAEEISWCECRLGERGRDGMVLKSHAFLRQEMKRIRTLEGRADLIDWVYCVGFGERRL